MPEGEGITSSEGLVIHGESNGGLLIGAVVNQRPDLFTAALPDVEADFRNLLAYSPLHNIRSGTTYPAILVTTADTG
nr:prolyl oligopeptidase family serine peptidase [Cupriavidus sp. UYPR2.512]